MEIHAAGENSQPWTLDEYVSLQLCYINYNFDGGVG